MKTRVLIPLWNEDVAPRFDLAQEALVALLGENGEIAEKQIIVLPQASAEGLCDFIIRERVDMVVCCAVDEECYQYLTWKKIKIFESVGGSAADVLERVRDGSLQSGDMVL